MVRAMYVQARANANLTQHVLLLFVCVRACIASTNFEKNHWSDNYTLHIVKVNFILSLLYIALVGPRGWIPVMTWNVLVARKVTRRSIVNFLQENAARGFSAKLPALLVELVIK